MLVVMEHNATAQQIERVVTVIEALGYEAQPIPGKQRTAIGIVGNDGGVDRGRLSALDGVRELIAVTKPYRRVSREWHPDDTVLTLNHNVVIGGPAIPIAAGPCSVESLAQIMDIAHCVREAGAVILRGGAFKPRTSPYAFQGIGPKGLPMLARAAEATGLLVVTEAMDPENVPVVEEHADIIQVGSRNMQNYSLLKRIGRSTRPVLLKRGIAATLTEWLLSAEYLLAEGNHRVILCERGVRGFDPTTRNIFDVAAIPATKRLSHLPVFADPSHATGDRALVTPMARAAIAAGADGILVEVHTEPERAMSDGAQSLYPAQFASLVTQLESTAGGIGRRLVTPSAPTPSAVLP